MKMLIMMDSRSSSSLQSSREIQAWLQPVLLLLRQTAQGIELLLFLKFRKRITRATMKMY